MRTLATTAQAALVAATIPAGADETADPAAAFRTDKGLASITKAVPGLTPVSDYTGDIWNRTTLFGDPGGRRQALYEKGITVDATLTQVGQSVVSGGGDTGATRYNGLFEYGASFDTAKLGLWSGGLFTVNAQTSFGKPLQGDAGTVSPVNFTAMFPRAFDNATELQEFYITQALPWDMSLVLGRIIDINFLDTNRFANDFRTQFLNASMSNDLLFGNFLNFSTYAGLLDIPVDKRFNIAFAAFDPETAPGDYAGVWENIGLATTMTFSWELPGGLEGSANPIFVYTSKESLAVDNPRLAVDILTGTAPTKSGNWMVHLGLEQYLWKPDGPVGDDNVRSKKFDYQEPGLGAFFRVGFVPEDRNPFNLFVHGGLGGRGIVPGRPYDRLGIGAYAMIESDDLRGEPFIGATLRNEVGLEAFYNVALTPWLQLSGDIQWIRPGVAANKDTVVLGMRLFTRF